MEFISQRMVIILFFLCLIILFSIILSCESSQASFSSLPDIPSASLFQLHNNRNYPLPVNPPPLPPAAPSLQLPPTYSMQDSLRRNATTASNRTMTRVCVSFLIHFSGYFTNYISFQFTITITVTNAITNAITINSSTKYTSSTTSDSSSDYSSTTTYILLFFSYQ